MRKGALGLLSLAAIGLCLAILIHGGVFQAENRSAYAQEDMAGARSDFVGRDEFSDIGIVSTDILLVNRSHPLADDFSPVSLVTLYEQKRHFLLASGDISLERVAFEAANAMFQKAEKDGVNGFILTSGYRTWEKQKELYDADMEGIAAAPGESEHQTGLAFDVTAKRDAGAFSDTPQYAWLIENCWEYGFILRYPQGKEAVTGFPCESWHYRYVGRDIALQIRDNGWTLEEYCEAN